MGGNACAIINLILKGRQYDNTPEVKTLKGVNQKLSLKQGKQMIHCQNPDCKVSYSKTYKECPYCHTARKRRKTVTESEVNKDQELQTQLEKKAKPKTKKSWDRRKKCPNPRCGQPVFSQLFDCPNCGTNIRTGIPNVNPLDLHERSILIARKELGL